MTHLMARCGPPSRRGPQREARLPGWQANPVE